MTAADPAAEDAITELRALAEALLEKVEPWLRAEAARTGDATDCGWCPLCALAAALRGQRPELTRRLAEQGTGWLSALRTLLETHDTSCAPRSAHHDKPAPPPRIQRIAVRNHGPFR